MIPLIKDVYPSDRQKKNNKMRIRKIYQSSWFNDKNASRKKKNIFPDLSCRLRYAPVLIVPQSAERNVLMKMCFSFPSQNLVLSPTTPWLHYWHRWLFVKLLFTKIFVGHWRSLICTSLLLFYFRVLNVPSIYVNV